VLFQVSPYSIAKTLIIWLLIGGKSEEAMGAAIKKFGWKRNDLVISTKVYT
jgi:hypothetical protein